MAQNRESRKERIAREAREKAAAATALEETRETQEEVVEEAEATEVAEETSAEVEETEAAPAAEGEVKKKKTYYNPATAKAYRERLMEFAKAGGYEPQPRREGTGASEKRTSKTGNTYYYTPWSKLTDEQKVARLSQSRERAKTERELAAKYKAEHPDEFPAKGAQ